MVNAPVRTWIVCIRLRQSLIPNQIPRIYNSASVSIAENLEIRPSSKPLRNCAEMAKLCSLLAELDNLIRSLGSDRQPLGSELA